MPEIASLSLIIPAYNEEAGIEKAVNQNLRALRGSGILFEIIIVDDGSRDGTRKVVEEKLLFLQGVRFHSKPNAGIGSAIRKGIELSGCTHIMFAPVDSPIDDKTLDVFLSHLGRADILVSYRLKRKGYTLRMEFNSFLYRLLISLLFGMSLKDYNWIHLYDKRIFKRIAVENERIFMLAEVLIKAKRLGYTFCEFPVEMQERKYGKKTAASLKVAFCTCADMIRFFLDIK